jgi:peptide-methionine (S)-S-oxide reductase
MQAQSVPKAPPAVPRLAAAAIVIAGLALAGSMAGARSAGPTSLPHPEVDAPLAAAASEESTVLSGGCFWGIQAVYQHVKGVKSAVSGYSGGAAATAHYEVVSMGITGHAESVKVTFDPSQISYGRLLEIFFSVAHDPTELNRQGPDTGSQYRSVVFYASDDQKRIAEAYISQLDKAAAFKHKIVTEVVPLQAFYPAEGYHQNYATLHPENPYIAINDAPKVEHLKAQFPELYRK